MRRIEYIKWKIEWCFRPRFYTVKAILDQRQPGKSASWWEKCVLMRRTECIMMEEMCSYDENRVYHDGSNVFLWREESAQPIPWSNDEDWVGLYYGGSKVIGRRQYFDGSNVFLWRRQYFDGSNMFLWRRQYFDESNVLWRKKYFDR